MCRRCLYKEQGMRAAETLEEVLNVARASEMLVTTFMSAVQVKSQCFFDEVLLNKLTADEVVVNCLNCCLLCQLSQVFIIQAEFQLYGLFFLHFMQAGNGKTDATPGNISNVDNPTPCS